MDFSLEKWDKKFIDDVTKYANNPKIATNLRNIFPNPYTKTDAEWYVTDCAENDESKQCTRAIVVAGHAVGSIGLFVQGDVYEKSAELGYWLAEDFWRKGIMTKAVKILSKFGFENYDIVRIFAEPYADNFGSRGVLEKAGFSLEGVLKKSVYKNEKFHDSCIYSLLK
ncbi:MAG: GNAT family protein [Oscillospiraceae bacterium]